MQHEMNLENIKDVAQKILYEIRERKVDKRATVLALEGDLGAGKTHLTKEIGNILGVEEEINSPTFVVMKMYETKDKDFLHLVHIDAYRLEEKDKDNLKLEEIFSRENTLVVVEWPEIIKNVLPENRIKVSIQHLEEEERLVNID